MPFLPPNQQCQSTEGKFISTDSVLVISKLLLTANFKHPIYSWTVDAGSKMQEATSFPSETSQWLKKRWGPCMSNCFAFDVKKDILATEKSASITLRDKWCIWLNHILLETCWMFMCKLQPLTNKCITWHRRLTVLLLLLLYYYTTSSTTI